MLKTATKGNRFGPDAEGGFTLLELIAVLFIVALAVGIALPSISGFAGESIKSEARKAAYILRTVHENTILRKQSFAVSFELDDHRVVWNIPAGRRQKQFGTLVAVELPSRGLVDEGTLTIVFEPRVVAEPLTLHFEDDGRRLDVKFNPLSGRALIRDAGDER